MWQQRLRAQLGPSKRACEYTRWSDDQHRPDVAFCIAGVARTLALPLTQQLLHLNLLRSFDGSNESALFMLLKTDGTAKWKGELANGSETGIADVENLLRVPWLRTWLQEAVILNGSGTTTRPGQGWGSNNFVVQSNESAWRAWRATKCSSSYVKKNGTQEGGLLISMPELHGRSRQRSSGCATNHAIDTANSYARYSRLLSPCALSPRPAASAANLHVPTLACCIWHRRKSG